MSWMESTDTHAAYVEWSMAGTRSVAVLTGFATYAGSDETTRVLPLVGRLANGDVTLTVSTPLGEEKMAGTVSATTLTLHITELPQSLAVPPSDCADCTPPPTDVTAVFHPATKARFDQLAAIFQIQGGMHSDLLMVATEFETYYTQFSRYPTTVPNGWRGSFVLGGDPVTLIAGDTVTAHLDADGSAYCLIASNPAVPQRDVYLSQSGGWQGADLQDCPANYK